MRVTPGLLAPPKKKNEDVCGSPMSQSQNETFWHLEEPDEKDEENDEEDQYQEDISKAEKPKSKCIIQPHNEHKVKWDLWVVIVLFFVAMTLPF